MNECQQGIENVKENLVMKSLRMVWYLAVKQLIRRCNLPGIGIQNQGIVHCGSEF